MSFGTFDYPIPANEPVLSYGPGSSERIKFQKAVAELRGQEKDIPMFIGGQEVRSGKTKAIHPPHDIAHSLGVFHAGDATHVQAAIEAGLTAKAQWASLSWESRAGIFLRAADLLATKYRFQMNAATMLGQSKNAYQAEIDSACELIDFLLPACRSRRQRHLVSGGAQQARPVGVGPGTVRRLGRAAGQPQSAGAALP